jgi:hypothetical protein
MFSFIGAENEQLHFFVDPADFVKYLERRDNTSNEGNRGELL